MPGGFLFQLTRAKEQQQQKTVQPVPASISHKVSSSSSGVDHPTTAPGVLGAKGLRLTESDKAYDPITSATRSTPSSSDEPKGEIKVIRQAIRYKHSGKKRWFDHKSYAKLKAHLYETRPHVAIPSYSDS